jgi:hypothetical protein
MRKRLIFLVIVIITIMSCGKNNTQKARVPLKESAQRVITLTGHDTACIDDNLFLLKLKLVL